MGPLQPLQDSFSALAGVPIRRTTRPGETFERPEKYRKSHRNRFLIRMLIVGIFLKIRIPLQHIS